MNFESPNSRRLEVTENATKILETQPVPVFILIKTSPSEVRGIPESCRDVWYILSSDANKNLVLGHGVHLYSRAVLFGNLATGMKIK